MRLTCVAGARPNFMKIAPVLAAAADNGTFETRLVHTGQHYDDQMSSVFFADLGLPEPDAHLGVGSARHAVQTAWVMEAFDRELERHPADIVVVVGDVNSTLACALVAVKRDIKVAHVEAGLRSGDRRMPEEINRILTDQISDYLFTTERSAAENLHREGISPAKIHFVGNVMIDTLLRHRGRARRRGTLDRLGLTPREYAVCTLHRPSNVDSAPTATNTVRALNEVCGRLPAVLPLHPRTRAKLREFDLLNALEHDERIRIIEPLGYLDFLALVDDAKLVFTDSGGIQEETTVLGVPCLTFREHTERPITVTDGTNQVLGLDPAWTAAAVDAVLAGRSVNGRVPERWDGRAAERIVSVLAHAAVASRNLDDVAVSM